MRYLKLHHNGRVETLGIIKCDKDIQVMLTSRFKLPCTCKAFIYIKGLVRYFIETK